jgi:hypothetical protein
MAPTWLLEMRRMAELIFMASSLSVFQLSLLSDTGLLEKFPLGDRTAIRDGFSDEARFKKLLPSMSRRGDFSLSEMGMLVDGGGPRGELPAFLDRNPALNRLPFF